MLTAPAPTFTVNRLESLFTQDLRFQTILADPPWRYDQQGVRGAAGKHYPTMSVDEIAALPVSALCAEQAHLHLWTTNAFLFDAKQVIEAWGFEYKTTFVWCKPSIGAGFYWRNATEFLLLAVRGSCPFLDRGQMNYLIAPRYGHSEKPEQIRHLIEKVSPTPRLELFARRIAPGWVAWGNDIERTLFDQHIPTLDEEVVTKSI